MADQSHDTTALLTEHFRYTPLTLLDEIINTVNELVYHAVNQLEKALATAPTDVLGFELNDSQDDLDEDSREAALEELRQNEVDLGIVQIESLLNATVDKDFDKFEIYTLRNILAVGHHEDADLARWMCLDHYRHLKLDPAQQHLTPESVQLQRRKLHETTKLNSMLRAESERNKLVLEQLEASSTSLAFLTGSSPNSTQEMQQLTEQLPRVRQTLAGLQTFLRATPTRQARSQQEMDAVKRRQYLDAQAVRALNSHGIEPAGHRQHTSGGSVSMDNVQAVEAVARALGGSDSS